jgi:hypothetical protein
MVGGGRTALRPHQTWSAASRRELARRIDSLTYLSVAAASHTAGKDPDRLRPHASGRDVVRPFERDSERLRADSGQ